MITQGTAKETNRETPRELTPQERVLNQISDLTEAYYASANPTATMIYELEIKQLIYIARRMGIVINYFGDLLRG